MEKSWKDAIKRVLREAQEPLHYSDISAQILAAGYYATEGATPAATVNAQLASSIKHDGERSPFLRVGKGLFALKDETATIGSKSSKSSKSSKPLSATAPSNQDDITSDIASDEAIMRSFGMYWQRELVLWRREAKLFGKQQAETMPIDFGRQKGIYILYDHHTVVYVGRSIDRPLATRLYEHTTDRLASRWNRFSWFGLLDATDDGRLQEPALNTSLGGIIAAFEALLIEALEPPQNRKRGDDFSGIEYIQAIDPELQERQLQATLRTLEQKLRGAS